MSALLWDGVGPVCSAPDADEPLRGQVRLRVLETLFGLNPSPMVLACRAVVERAGPEASLAPGTAVIARCAGGANDLTLDAGLCQPIAIADTGSCLLAPLAEALGAIDRVRPDLGWNALVVGSSLRSELLLRLAGHCGARHLASLRAAGEPLPDGGQIELFQGDPASVHPALAAHLKQLRGPLVAFCDDVHRKNIRVFGCGPAALQPCHWLRASALLEHGRLDFDRLGVGCIQAEEGSRPESEGRWLVLTWPSD